MAEEADAAVRRARAPLPGRPARLQPGRRRSVRRRTRARARGPAPRPARAADVDQRGDRAARRADGVDSRRRPRPGERDDPACPGAGRPLHRRRGRQRGGHDRPRPSSSCASSTPRPTSSGRSAERLIDDVRGTAGVAGRAGRGSASSGSRRTRSRTERYAACPSPSRPIAPSPGPDAVQCEGWSTGSTPPRLNLRPWLDCLWERDGDGGSSGPRAPGRLHRRGLDQPAIGTRIVGANTTAFMPPWRLGEHLVGARLRPGGAPALLGLRPRWCSTSAPRSSRARRPGRAARRRARPRRGSGGATGRLAFGSRRDAPAA